MRHGLDSPSECCLSDSDLNRLRKCIEFMNAVATPDERACIAALAPGAAAPSAAVQRLGPPFTVARGLAAKVFQRRLPALELKHHVKTVMSRGEHFELLLRPRH